LKLGGEPLHARLQRPRRGDERFCSAGKPNDAGNSSADRPDRRVLQPFEGASALVSGGVQVGRDAVADLAGGRRRFFELALNVLADALERRTRLAGRSARLRADVVQRRRRL
jgi:hypothetical protein